MCARGVAQYAHVRGDAPTGGESSWRVENSRFDAPREMGLLFKPRSGQAGRTSVAPAEIAALDAGQSARRGVRSPLLTAFTYYNAAPQWTNCGVE
jgi:hypothetical protein